MIRATCAEILVTQQGRHLFATDSAIRHYTDEQVAAVVRLLKTVFPTERGYHVCAFHRGMQQSDIIDEANAFDPAVIEHPTAAVEPPVYEQVMVIETGWANPRVDRLKYIPTMLQPFANGVGRQYAVFPCHTVIGQFTT